LKKASHKLWFSLLHKSPCEIDDVNYPDVHKLNGMNDLAENHGVVLEELKKYLSQHVFESHFNNTMVEKPRSWKVRSLRVWGVETEEIKTTEPLLFNFFCLSNSETVWTAEK